jgi:hypothetical protein
MKLLSDVEIDRIAHAQDDGEWLTKQLTKLEWRAFASDIAQAAVQACKGRACEIADEAMMVQLQSHAQRYPGPGLVIPVDNIDAYEQVTQALEWLGPRGYVRTSGKRPGDDITIVKMPGGGS